MSEFQEWPKTPRWNREVVITEKIDGTNAAIVIEEHQFGASLPVVDGLVGDGDYMLAVIFGPANGEDGLPNTEFHVYAQSRKRLIHPGKTTDNYGFAAWVQENAAALVNLLGPGRHFGEWYGQGIQRGYDLDHKRFALFNTNRYGTNIEGMTGFHSDKHPYQISDLPIDVVPSLGRLSRPGERVFCDMALDDVLDQLESHGSWLAPGFMRPEGVILHHTASRQNYKILLENDEWPKGLTA